MRLNETSIYTEPLKFSPDSFPTSTPLELEPIPDVTEGEEDDVAEGEEEKEEKEEEGMLEDEESPPWVDDDRRLGRAILTGKREEDRQWDLIDSITEGVKGATSQSEEPTESGERQDEEAGGGNDNAVYEVPTYSGAIHYKVPKTGYYCVGTSFLLFHQFLLLSWPTPITSHPSHSFDGKKMIQKLMCRDRTSNTPKPTFDSSPRLKPGKETGEPR
jgi:hypothetical protein